MDGMEPWACGFNESAYSLGFYPRECIHESLHRTDELAGVELEEHRASGTGIFDGNNCWPNPTNVPVSIPPPMFGMSYYSIFGESCNVSDPWPPTDNFENANHIQDQPNWEYTEDDQTYTRNAQTKLKLQTGGRALPHGMCLFQITAYALEGLDKRAGPPYLYDVVPPYNPVGMAGIPPQNVRMGVLGNLGSDGNRWVPLPAGGTTVEATPQVSKPFYVFGAEEQKYTLHISARGNGFNYPDLSETTPQFCAGDPVTLSLDWVPSVACRCAAIITS